MCKINTTVPEPLTQNSITKFAKVAQTGKREEPKRD
jgi:hypothetical protein